MNKTLVKTVQSEEAMLALGKRLAAALQPGAFVCLNGELGAGKTVLVRGAASVLGIDTVASPTFTIVQEYPTEPPFFHFDVYRIADFDELYAIGFEDYLARNGLLFMEWSCLVPEALPAERLEIQISGSGEEARTVCFTAYGSLYEEVLERL